MRLFAHKLLPLLAALIFPLPLNPAWGDDNGLGALDGIGRAYSYMLGQELILTRIVDYDPSLASQVKQTRDYFAKRFPHIQAKLESRLRDEFGGNFPEIHSQLQTRIVQNMGRLQMSREASQAFLATVRKRADGDIESPVLENLLAVQYADDSAREFLDGWRSRYETSGNREALGVRLALQVPRSWSGHRGKASNVVQAWRSECGYGPNLLQLMVFDATNWSLDDRDIATLQRRGELKKLVPPGYRLLNSGTFSLERETGGWVEMSGVLKIPGQGVYQHMLMYSFSYENRAVQLLCGTGGLPDEWRQADAAFESLRPLCGQVLDSVVLLRNY